ncbi:hypothetical protein JW905_19300 [bacterium]|nr:hypothetical protein [candidate division CSSED10-310 bacterium]
MKRTISAGIIGVLCIGFLLGSLASFLLAASRAAGGTVGLFSILKDGETHPFQIDSVLRAPTIKADQTIWFDNENARMWDLYCVALTLDMARGAELKVSAGTGEYILRMMTSGDKVVYSLDDREPVAVPVGPDGVEVTVSGQDDAWLFTTGSVSIGTAPRNASMGAGFSLAATGGDTRLRAIGVTAGDGRKHYTQHFGGGFITAPETLRFIILGGLLILAFSVAYAGLLSGHTIFSFRNAMLLDWLTWFPAFFYLLGAFSRHHPSKTMLVFSGLACLVLKTWLAFMIGRHYKAFNPTAKPRLLALLGVAAGFGFLALIYVHAPLNMCEQGATRALPGPFTVDMGTSHLIADTFTWGEVRLRLNQAADSAVAVVFDDSHGSGQGFLASSDPRLPSRLYSTWHERIDRGTSGSGLIIPADEEVELLLERTPRRLRVWVGSELAADEASPACEATIRIQAIRGEAVIENGSIRQDIHYANGRFDLADAPLILTLLLFLTLIAVTLTTVLDGSFGAELTLVLAAMAPFLAGLVLRARAAAAGAPQETGGWTCMISPLGLMFLLFVIMIRLAVGIHNSRRLVVILVLLSLAVIGLTEDMLRCWLPGRQLYYLARNHCFAEAPVPAGYEWFLAPCMRFDNDYVTEGSFNGRCHSLTHEPEVTRILCLGGSTTAGIRQQSALGESFPALLHHRLDSREPGAWEVINGGVQGYTILQARLWFEGVLRNFRPDVVVLDSLYNNAGMMYPESQKRLFERLGTARDTWARRWWFGMLQTRLGMRIPALLGKFRDEVPPLTPEEYGGELTAFLALTREDGCRLVCVREPCKELLTEGKNALTEYDRTLQDFCGVTGCPLVDIMPALAARPQDYFIDAVHLDTGGNLLLAEAIEAVVVDGGGKHRAID